MKREVIRSRAAFLIVGGVVVVSAATAAMVLWPRESLPIVPATVDCGPRTLQIALGRLGIPAHYRDISNEVDFTAKGVSLSELARAARMFGGQCDIVRLDWSSLFKAQSPAVLFVGGDHFMVADPRQAREGEGSAQPMEGVIRVYDADGTPRWYSRAALERIWNGECLLIRADEAVGGGSGGSGLRFSSCYEDAGDLEAYHNVASFEIDVTNTGPERCHVEIAGRSCSCTSAELSAAYVEPGSKVRVTARVALSGKHGYFRERLTLRTDAKGAREVEIFLSGNVIPNEIASTDNVLFTGVVPGGTKTEQFILHAPPGRTLEVLGVDIISEVAPPGVKVRSSIRTIEVNSPEIGTIGRYRVSPGDVAVALTVACDGSGLANTFRGVAKVRTNLPGGHSEVVVGYSGSISSDLRVNPGSVLLRAGVQESVTLRVTRHSGLSVAATSFVVEGAPVKWVTANSDDSGVMVIEVSVDDTATVGKRPKVGRIRVRCDALTATVPVVVLGMDRE